MVCRFFDFGVEIIGFSIIVIVFLIMFFVLITFFVVFRVSFVDYYWRKGFSFV